MTASEFLGRRTAAPPRPHFALLSTEWRPPTRRELLLKKIQLRWHRALHPGDC